MKVFKTLRLKHGIALAALAFVVGCGNGNEAARSQQVIDDVLALLSPKARQSQKAEATALPDPNQMIQNALVAFEGEPLLFYLRETTGAYGVASPYGRNGDVTTWGTRDLVSVSLRRGVLTATRGLGNDVMSVDDGGSVSRIIRKSPGSVRKTYRFLNGLDQTSRLAVECDISLGEVQPVSSGEISVQAQIVQEKCVFKGLKFTNLYWVDQSGRIVQSAQWAGPQNRRLIFRQLRW